eukprot:CAMPEP_0172408448 /NCGR_PEP_ID=MMETSP1061-20121228/75862_1 /TAXON_ID=37318 /ORGANISM="Pseudo-nitzschia pungens, Strain cf. pungens" /LENGTH=80 /DNA_ID=CAMNT_0013144581 /DNA_START=1127 /DNA_END=1366 /DNA_ORIENTATION=+
MPFSVNALKRGAEESSGMPWTLHGGRGAACVELGSFTHSYGTVPDLGVMFQTGAVLCCAVPSRPIEGKALVVVPLEPRLA